jgi:hypothetical protein
VILSLGVVLGFEAGSFPAGELVRRARALPAFASRPAAEAILHGTAFGFDRKFGLFLEGVRRATPAESTVAIGGLGSSPVYRYTASYLLAPRRVVSAGDLTTADYAAVFGASRAPGSPVQALVPYGSVGRLR